MPPPVTVPADIITFRLRGRMVYVNPAQTHEEAVRLARESFPELANVISNRISFSITVFVQTETQTVTISPGAWSAVLSTLARFEIIDVNVDKEKDAPPLYTEASLAPPHAKGRSRSAPPPSGQGRASITQWLGRVL